MPIPIVYNPKYSYPFPSKHRFPMEKFSLLFDYLSSANIVKRNNVFRPGRIHPDVIKLAHCEEYYENFVNNEQTYLAQRKMGLPWSPQLVERTLISPNGTLLAANLALNYGVACHLAGGTHHAHYNYASGYCIFNDLAITARYLVSVNKVNRVLIFDCDVHQGDGTASILQDDHAIFTCSIHCESNFPTYKPASNLDVALAAGIGDDVYLEKVSSTLEQAIRLSQPDIILYDAGVDVLADDSLGKLQISLQGLRQREHEVLNIVKSHSIPVATVIGGGYHSDQLELAKRHALIIEQANYLFGQ